MQYTQDYDSYMVPQENQNPTRKWPTLIFPYIKSKEVFACPSTSGANFQRDARFVNVGTRMSYCDQTTSDGGTNIPDRVTGLSYSRNLIPNDPADWFSDATWGTAANPKQGFVNTQATDPLNEAAIGDIAGTIHIVDGMASNTAATCGVGQQMVLINGEKDTDIFPDSETSKPAYRHFDGFNALYGDGHVKWRRWGTTKPGNWSIQADD